MNDTEKRFDKTRQDKTRQDKTYGNLTFNVKPLCDLEVGGQKGIVYYPFGISPCLTATQYKDPYKVLIQI